MDKDKVDKWIADNYDFLVFNAKSKLAKHFVTSIEPEELVELTADDLKVRKTLFDNPSRTDVLSVMDYALVHGVINQKNKIIKSKRAERESDSDAKLTFVFDSDTDRDTVAEFFGELARLYKELSNGDELIIREGRFFAPIETAVPV